MRMRSEDSNQWAVDAGCWSRHSDQSGRERRCREQNLEHLSSHNRPSGKGYRSSITFTTAFGSKKNSKNIVFIITELRPISPISVSSPGVRSEVVTLSSSSAGMETSQIGWRLLWPSPNHQRAEERAASSWPSLALDCSPPDQSV